LSSAWRLILYLVLALGLGGGSPPAAAQDPLDLQIALFSTGSGPDTIAVAYRKPPPKGQIEKDMAELGGMLGIPPPKAKISGDGGIYVAEAIVPGLTNWSEGVVNLDPLVHPFRRFGVLRVSCFFQGPFPLKSPIGNETRGRLRWETTVNGTSVDYKVWVDQRDGPPETLPSTAARGTPVWKLIAGTAAIALVVGGAVYLIVQVVLGRRRDAAGDTNAVRE